MTWVYDILSLTYSILLTWQCTVHERHFIEWHFVEQHFVPLSVCGVSQSPSQSHTHTHFSIISCCFCECAKVLLSKYLFLSPSISWSIYRLLGLLRGTLWGMNLDILSCSCSPSFRTFQISSVSSDSSVPMSMTLVDSSEAAALRLVQSALL